MSSPNKPLLAALDDATAIAIWGFGREGRTTLAHFHKRGVKADITLVADHAIEDAPTGVAVLTGDEGSKAITDGLFDVIIKSPGISLYRPEVTVAKEAGCLVTSATNIWFAQNTATKTLAITGTKGKSTTAKLAHHLLAALGAKAELAGNVGRPVLDVETTPDVMVMELSSYQIADLQFAPTVAVVLNLYPEHLPWHGDVETYYHDKLRLLDTEPAPIPVLNANSFETKQRFKSSKAAQWFNEPSSYHVQGGALWQGKTQLLASNNFVLKGEHNLANLAAAMTAVAALGFDPVPALGSLKNFEPLPHRLQELGENNGVLFVNDSISTTPQSVLAALAAYPDQPKVLLLGGEERGLDYIELAQSLIAKNVMVVLTLPDNGPRIAQTVREHAPAVVVVECEGLAPAVVEAMVLATKNSVVLLSPAAPSFGHFRDYEERGQLFAQLAGFDEA